ncbi:MAG: respiratory nitrate reductase subunit gamma [Flavobacteriia bacterium]|jgi:nitrate reductase gamma subunit
MKKNQKLINFGHLKNKCSIFNSSFFRSMLGVFTLILIIIYSTETKAQGGEQNFNKLCMTCHSFTDKVLVGPGLGGLKDRREEEWILKWVKDPQGLISANDEYAVKLFNDFNKIPMPGFPQLKDEEIKDILAFVESKAGPVASAASGDSGTSQATAATPDTAVQQQDTFFIKYGFWMFFIVAIAGFLLYRFKRKTTTFINHLGFYDDPHKIPNYIYLFFMYIGIAGSLALLIVYLLDNNFGKINDIMFVVLPYLSFGIFLVGSIYRYLNRGYQVTSLSTQFLEGKKLFWGSQPFHWGIIILFFGHLIAFLFPSSVLAWNGHPVRLLILEFSSFAFGLAALFGLVMLIKRRLSSKTLLVVANKMDMVVYTVLVTQIVSGLGVAFFVRWGSSWFSSVLTPYLRSVFSFNPDITAVSEMPWLIQLHIISAFVIIAIIPFTRFVHFLVAPVDYIWRKYQLVIWNWSPRKIRTSTKWNFGKKPRNH